MNSTILITLSVDELKNLVRDCLREELNLKKEKEILSFRETMDLLGISASTLNKMKAEGKVPFRKAGKRILFQRKEVIAALKNLITTN